MHKNYLADTEKNNIKFKGQKIRSFLFFDFRLLTL